MMRNVFSTKNLEITNSYLRGYLIEGLKTTIIRLQRNGTLEDLNRDNNHNITGNLPSNDLPYKFNLTNHRDEQNPVNLYDFLKMMIISPMNLYVFVRS